MSRLAALSLQGIGGGTVIATLPTFIDQAPYAVARAEAEKVLGRLGGYDCGLQPSELPCNG